MLPGTAAPITVDNLTYTYSNYSNKLQTVTDNMTNTTVNGAFADFKDGTNGATPDYVYDANGNLLIDLNKNAKDLGNVVGANGIKYNFLDKPEQIRIAGKGTIQITYSADGEKLQRSFTPEPSGAIITTTYINQYVYQETSTSSGAVLQFMNFEEGRIRIITPTAQGNGLDALIVDGNMDLPNGKRGAYDYFIMDYQQNVRMILTEENHTASNTCTMETSRAALEESIFGQAGASNEVATTRYATPPGWTGNTTSQVSRLGTLGSGHNVGPNTLQKVMAGDVVNATVLYYHQGIAGGNSPNMVGNVLGSLLQAITGGNAAGTLVKSNAANITSQLNGISGFINAVQPNGSNPSGNVPQAFLTVIFFDERFNFIPAADGGVAQQQVAASVGSNGSSLTLANIKAPKNGYAFIYISNQSNNDVYFDNLQVGIAQGNIAEENHYYAYGLKIATLSSKKLGDSYEGTLKNNYLYQGAYSEMDDDIGWNDFALRNYDPQIGRWVQQDPYQEFASGYVGMGGDPVNLVDPSGGETSPYQVIKLGGEMSQTAATAITLSEVVVSSVSTAARTVSTLSRLMTVANISIKVFQVANIINTSISTNQIGEPGPDYGKGFWHNFFKGLGDGAIDTKDFVKSLGTLKGWYDFINGLGKINPLGAWTPDKIDFFSNSSQVIMEKLKQIPDMNADDWGYAIGYGSEKVVEIIIANKVAAALKAKISPVASETIAKTGTTVLEGAVKENYGRFVKSMPANAKSSTSWKLLDDGSYLFEGTSPATNIPGSKAVYQKWVNAQGETTKMIKTTYAPDGSIVHVKTKF